jgi:hypothetical protein
VTIGVDLCYATGEVRGGAATAAETAEMAGAVAERIAGVVIEVAVFGEVAQAAVLGAGLVAVRDGAAELGRQLQRVHADLAARAGAVAQAGDQLTQETSARAIRPGLGGR